jgi:hypothetical protein
LSDIGGKHVEIPSEVTGKPYVPYVEEVGTKLVEEKCMQNAPTNVDMEKEKIHEVVNEEVILGEEDDRPQYLEDEDVEITIIKEPFHQQLERELLLQLEKDEPTKKS